MTTLLYFLLAASQCSSDRTAPCYSTASVVNSATSQPVLAPNGMATIYGTFLSFSTASLSSADAQGGLLPVQLAGTGVTVVVDGLAAPVWYVSPSQVNFLVPGGLRPGRNVDVWLSRDGKAGPIVSVRLAAESPGLFAADPETVIAVKLDGSLVKMGQPARSGESVILFATGLGATTPDTPYRQVPRGAASLSRLSDFRILLNGLAVGAENIGYAGVAPGFAGLYQINFTVPAEAPGNPEIRIAIGSATSPPGLRLPLRQAPSGAEP